MAYLATNPDRAMYIVPSTTFQVGMEFGEPFMVLYFMTFEGEHPGTKTWSTLGLGSKKIKFSS